MSATAVATPSLIQVPIGDLFPSPLNPRKRFTPESLADLTANIQKRGEVVQPLLLRTKKSGINPGLDGKGKRFEIIDGERRFRSSQAAKNIVHLPGLVRDDLSDSDCIEFMLLTSIQKQELTPLEEAGGFKALIDSNKAKYSAAYIADRIGRSEKYVWDRMKLLDLIPILKQLLDAERILVGHAELLCKLKPEDQKRAVDPHRTGHGVNGLWQDEDARLAFDDGERPSEKNLYAGLKPVTVKELETWIAEHVRFDVDHMAKSAPLEFAATKAVVDQALAQPGRGKKVISITDDHRVDDEAKDPNERTYGSQSWKRADGKDKSKTCEHSVLGVFVAGPGYGSTLQVCVNREKCEVHFGAVIRERKKNEKLRQQGKGGQAAQREHQVRQREEQQRAKEEAQEKAWQALKPKAVEAIDDFIAAQPIKKLLPVVVKLERFNGVKTADDFVRAVAMGAATQTDWNAEYLARNCQRFGFDLKKWIADHTKAQAPLKAEKKLAGGKQVQEMRSAAAKKAKKR
jgi:ParB/RepB/Spo0J family partition protein